GPSPLSGIRVGLQAIYATRGVPPTAGSAVLADWVPDADATCVTKLQQAGAVMLGKLITHEFAMGIQLPGHRFPAAANPWNVQHMPGGSSSGSGAALAAGLLAGATGSGTGGARPGAAALCPLPRPPAPPTPAGAGPACSRCPGRPTPPAPWPAPSSPAPSSSR